jgi:mRNA interferase MazF
MARQKSRQVAPRRGQVYIVSFDPTVGAEIRKARPALVIQNDVANRFSPITIVAAITSRTDDKLYPTEVALPRGEAGMTADSVVLLNQIRSIDKRRLVKRLGAVRPDTMRSVERAVRVSLGLLELQDPSSNVA